MSHYVSNLQTVTDGRNDLTGPSLFTAIKKVDLPELPGQALRRVRMEVKECSSSRITPYLHSQDLKSNTRKKRAKSLMRVLACRMESSIIPVVSFLSISQLTY